MLVAAVCFCCTAPQVRACDHTCGYVWLRCVQQVCTKDLAASCQPRGLSPTPCAHQHTTSHNVVMLSIDSTRQPTCTQVPTPACSVSFSRKFWSQLIFMLFCGLETSTPAITAVPWTHAWPATSTLARRLIRALRPARHRVTQPRCWTRGELERTELEVCDLRAHTPSHNVASNVCRARV